MMSPSSPDSGSGHADQDCEINLASIIDCFTVLITYLLVSASFISLSQFDVGVAMPVFNPTEAAPTGQLDPALSITIEVRDDLSVELATSGALERKEVIPAQDGKVGVAGIQAKIEKLLATYPTTKAALLTAEKKVKYREIIRVVEGLKSRLPELALGDRS
jgi:biopolymer transport protein ExbD